MIFSFISLIIPLGLGIAGLLGALMAHRGYPTKGTWTLLISSIVFLVLILVLGAMTIFAINGGGGATGSFLDYLAMVLAILWFLSFLGLSLGSFLMTSAWKKLTEETQDLEQLAQQLAAEREDIERGVN